MRFALGPAAAQLRHKVRSFFRSAEQDEDRGALDRRLQRVTAFSSRPLPLDQLSIAEESRAAPLYEQSVYGSISVAAREEPHP